MRQYHEHIFLEHLMEHLNSTQGYERWLLLKFILFNPKRVAGDVKRTVNYFSRSLTVILRFFTNMNPP